VGKELEQKARQTGARAAAATCAARASDVTLEETERASEASTPRQQRGRGVLQELEEMSIEEWNSVIEDQLTGVFLCSAADPRMKKRGGGYIIILESGRRTPFRRRRLQASKIRLNG